MNFSNEEYKTRLKKVQNSMQEKGIELLISSDTANMNYLTGYDAWSFYYAQAVVVHVNAKEPLCWIRKQDSGGAYIKTYLKSENVIAYDEKRKTRLGGVDIQRGSDKAGFTHELWTHYVWAESEQRIVNEDQCCCRLDSSILMRVTPKYMPILKSTSIR